MIYTKVLKHKVANLLIKCDEEHILSVDFMPFKSFKDSPNDLSLGLCKQLELYLDGQSSDFSTFKLAFAKPLSEFAKGVFNALVNVPYAQQWPYKELGFYMQSRAYMAIGTALSNNPFLIILPCHRIIRSDATLGKYSSAIGDKGKQLLCEHEARFIKTGTQMKPADPKNFVFLS